MISIQWLKFLFLISSVYFSTNYIFLTMFFSFLIPYLHGYSMVLKNIFSSSSFPFFPSSSSFAFLFFPHFPFISFFFPNFPLFFSFSQFEPFPQFGLPFPKSTAPVLPHFLLPWPAQPCTVKRIVGTVWPIPSAVVLGRACHTLHFRPAAWYFKLAKSGSTTIITKWCQSWL